MSSQKAHDPWPSQSSGEHTSRISPAPAASAQPNALAERIKELNCLYGISNLFENQDVSLEWIMKRAVDLIPAAWQYPEQACARIRLDGQEYASENFQVTPWSQQTTIILNSEPVGQVEVYYQDPPPECMADPFLREEERLLKAIGERLSRVLWLKRSEEALKESEERYRILTEQVTEGVCLVQEGRFCYVNPEFCNIFNIPDPQALIGELLHAPSAGPAAEIALFYNSLTESMPESRQEVEHQLDRAEKTFWIQVCHSPITLQGKPALLSTFKDITAIKEQQLAAQRKAELLRQENRALRSSLTDRYRFGDIVGRSQPMQTVYELILKAAATETSVAIFGESGTGKELVANAIHNHSPRRNKAFIAVNCGAIQDSLFEREFFGHRRGAFTGAHADCPGYLDLASGGTLFLDEISQLTVNMQAKLLRAIEGRDYRPVGSSESFSADFRIVSASNADLNDKVSQGEMRKDFYYRIQVVQIRIPPLRARKEDIPLLVEHFCHQMQNHYGNIKIPGSVMDRFMEYEWPGNVRELRNVLQRYAALGHTDFPLPESKQELSEHKPNLLLREAVQNLESSLIAQAIQQSGGNRTVAARLLGISRRALFRKMSSQC